MQSRIWAENACVKDFNKVHYGFWYENACVKDVNKVLQSATRKVGFWYENACVKDVNKVRMIKFFKLSMYARQLYSKCACALCAGSAYAGPELKPRPNGGTTE